MCGCGVMRPSKRRDAERLKHGYQLVSWFIEYCVVLKYIILWYMFMPIISDGSDLCMSHIACYRHLSPSQGPYSQVQSYSVRFLETRQPSSAFLLPASLFRGLYFDLLFICQKLPLRSPSPPSDPYTHGFVSTGNRFPRYWSVHQ